MKNTSIMSDEEYKLCCDMGLEILAERERKERTEHKERKPVVEATVETMWQFDYQAKNPLSDEILASDSLSKLKNAVRDRRWWMAHITTSHGVMSYGQALVDDCPYRPRYR